MVQKKEQDNLLVAVDVSRKAVVVNPQDAQAWGNLGFNLSELDRHEEAVDAYKRALEIDPSYDLARDNLEEHIGKVATTPPERIIEKETVIREVYLVICAHCSAKSPQGSLKCQKCGADL